MITFNSIKLRNFMSVGNRPQEVNLKSSPLSVVLGQNNDTSNAESGNSSRNGVGKAQPLTAKIKTPDGWTTMGDISIGDTVSTPDGKNAKVSGIFPQGKVQTYKIEFSDGRFTECCGDHLWKVFSCQWNKLKNNNGWKIINTKEMIELMKKSQSQTNYLYIELLSSDSINDVELPLDPWKIGFMLGAGDFRDGFKFTTTDEECVNFMTENLLEGHSLKHYGKYNYTISVGRCGLKENKYQRISTDLGLWDTSSETKFIPEIYKNSSINQRKELIQGLMDSDGYVSKNGSLSYSTVSIQLANDLVEVVRSIGGIASIKEKQTYYTYKGEKKKGKLSYTVKIRYSNPRELVRLPRKLERIPEDYQYKNLRLKVENINQIEDKESQCIMIDSEEHLYITDDYIVTHNTTVLQAIHWVIFGKSIENKIKVGNLVNKTNKKNCEVTIEFTISGTTYTLKRSMKPNQLNFKIHTSAGLIDVAQGENKDTQTEINNILNLTPQLFSHIVTLTSYIRPFLEETTAKQRDIMEELLGVTQLSEKAAKLKELNKEIKSNIALEEKQIEALSSSNEKIKKAIYELEHNANEYDLNIQNQLKEQKIIISKYDDIDFEKEFKAHEQNKEISEKLQYRMLKVDNLERLETLANSYESEKIRKETELKEMIKTLEWIDFEKEIENHNILQEYNIKKLEYNQRMVDIQSYIKELSRLTEEYNTINSKIEITNDKIKSIKPESCPTCGSDINNETYEKILSEYNDILKSYVEKHSEIELKIKELGEQPTEISKPEKIETIFSTVQEVFESQNMLFNLKEELSKSNTDKNPYFEEIESLKHDINSEIVEDLIETHFKTEKDTQTCYYELQNSQNKIEELENNENPYNKQVESMKNTLNIINYEELNRLKSLQEHQTFLLKLLTSKDSFVRKRIIDQNINYLNTRLEHYLSKTGLPHKVKFQNDLTVDITHLGLSYDFGNLSRGEKTRCIIALSLAFRDTFEALHQSINFMMIDELFDLGIDTSGIHQCFKMINEFALNRNKNVFLVSHREEILEKNVSIMMVIKENGFTHIEQQ